MIKRTIHTHIRKSAALFPFVVLTGPRQSGKTSLVRRLFPDYTYVNFELPDVRREAIDDPRGFIRRHPVHTIIDEVQRVPDILSYLMVHVDEHKIPGSYILTGSQQFHLMASVTQSLAGRVAIHTLYPFSLEEYDTESSIEETIVRGSFPQVATSSIDWLLWYQNYVGSFLEKDIRQLTNVLDLSLFERFLILCAGRTGQLWNASSIASDIGATHNTINRWLSLLETSGLVFRIAPYYKNINKRIIKMPKMYIIDTGLACYLLGIRNATDLRSHPLYGALFETFVMSEYIKHVTNRGEKRAPWFFRDRNGLEIDLVIERHGALIPVEIKSGETANPIWTSPILRFQKIPIKTTLPHILYGGDRQTSIRQVAYHPWKTMHKVFNVINRD